MSCSSASSSSSSGVMNSTDHEIHPSERILTTHLESPPQPTSIYNGQPAGQQQNLSIVQPSQRSYPFLFSTHHQPVYIAESEKLRKIRLRRERKESKREKNVNVEYRTDSNVDKPYNLDKVLEDIGDIGGVSSSQKKVKQLNKVNKQRRRSKNSCEDDRVKGEAAGDEGGEDDDDEPSAEEAAKEPPPPSKELIDSVKMSKSSDNLSFIEVINKKGKRKKKSQNNNNNSAEKKYNLRSKQVSSPPVELNTHEFPPLNDESSNNSSPSSWPTSTKTSSINSDVIEIMPPDITVHNNNPDSSLPDITQINCPMPMTTSSSSSAASQDGFNEQQSVNAGDYNEETVEFGFDLNPELLAMSMNNTNNSPALSEQPLKASLDSEDKAILSFGDLLVDNGITTSPTIPPRISHVQPPIITNCNYREMIALVSNSWFQIEKELKIKSNSVRYYATVH